MSESGRALRIDILVAAYALDARDVLAGLARQALPEGVTVHLHLGDDASPAPWGPRLAEAAAEYGAHLHRPEGNLGRAGMRDWLVSQSAGVGATPPGPGDLIVFLDGDSRLPDDALVARYVTQYHNTLADRLEHEGPALLALAGGTAYDPEPPPAGEGRLRWAYGRRYEQRARPHRLPDGGYTGVALNNLCLTRGAYERSGGLGGLPAGYGHEDTQLGLALGRAGVQVLAVGNPVVHTGLDADEVFIAKSREAAARLAGLVRAGLLPPRATALTHLGGYVASLGPLGKAIAGALEGLGGRAAGYPMMGVVGLQALKLGAYVRALLDRDQASSSS